MLCITYNSIKHQSFVYIVTWSNSSISNSSIKHKSFVCTYSTCQTVLFQGIQFNISTQFSSIWPIDRTLSGATALGQSEPERDSNGNEGVLHIPESSSITRALPSDCLMLYPEHS